MELDLSGAVEPIRQMGLAFVRRLPHIFLEVPRPLRIASALRGLAQARNPESGSRGEGSRDEMDA